MASLAITIIGPDRTGIINELAHVATAYNANWVDSHMANLGGQFAGIVRLDVADSIADDVATAFRNLESTGLTVVVAKSTEPRKVAHRMIELDILGQDHPGIIRDISQVLNDCGVSIEELETEQISGPVSGEKMFKARAKLSVPDAVNDDELNDRLQDIANDIMVDVVLDEA